MRTALSETVIEGINTNVDLHRELLVDAKFVAGGTSIHYLRVAGAAQALMARPFTAMPASGDRCRHFFFDCTTRRCAPCLN